MKSIHLKSTLARLASLEPKQQNLYLGLILLGVIIFVYSIITGPFLASAHGASQNYKRITQEYEQKLIAVDSLKIYQEKLLEEQNAFALLDDKMFSQISARSFLESLSTLAQKSNLITITRKNMEPHTFLVDPIIDKKHSEDAIKEVPVPFEIHRAQVVVEGDYENIVHYIKTIVGRKEQVSITNMRIWLMPGEHHTPRAKFHINILVDIPWETIK